jgi:hypothetical protein
LIQMQTPFGLQPSQHAIRIGEGGRIPFEVAPVLRAHPEAVEMGDVRRDVALMHAVHVGIEHGDLLDGQWVPDGRKDTLHARFVVGADGANPFVRRALNISTDDLGFSFDWIVVDVIPHAQRA